MKRNIVIDSSIEPELRALALVYVDIYEREILSKPNPFVYGDEFILSYGDRNIYVKKVKTKQSRFKLLFSKSGVIYHKEQNNTTEAKQTIKNNIKTTTMQEFETIKEFFHAIQYHEGELTVIGNKAVNENKEVVYLLNLTK